MDLGFDVVVTITGIVLVFAILVLLMAIITLEGKIFDAMNGKKAAAKAASAAKPAAPVKQAAAPAPAKAAAPQVEAGIPGDVVAAIMAAIYSMGNGKYVLKAVRRGKNGWQGWCQRHHRTFLTREEKYDTVYQYSGRYFPELRFRAVRRAGRLAVRGDDLQIGRAHV